MADKWNGFRGAAKQADDRDISRLAKLIGCGEDPVHAFMDVEAAGDGFDSHGRPKMLRETHAFYVNLGPGPKRDRAVRMGLATPKWVKNYPKDSYADLAKMMAIDETAALESCSWGALQVMGSNHRQAGYPDVQSMVRAAMDDEENHIRMGVNFIKAEGIDDEMRAIDRLKRSVTAADCIPIVRVYNGKGYAANNYHTKFAAAMNRWKRRPDIEDADQHETMVGLAAIRSADTPHEAPDEEEDDHIDYKDGEYHDAVYNAQKRLDELGYPEVGSVDGKWGRKTQTAVLAFRAENGLPLTPTIDDGFLAELMVAPQREIDTTRATTTVKDLRAEGAEEIKIADQTQSVGVAVGGMGAVGGAASVIQSLDGYSSVAQSFTSAILPIQDFLRDYFWVLALGVGAFIVWKSGVLKSIRVFKHQTGQDVSR